MFFFLVACTAVGFWIGGVGGALVGLLFAAGLPYVLAFFDT